jgi:hypothetical protein
MRLDDSQMEGGVFAAERFNYHCIGVDALCGGVVEVGAGGVVLGFGRFIAACGHGDGGGVIVGGTVGG